MEKRRDAGVIAVDSGDDTPERISGALIPTEYHGAVFLEETDPETITVEVKPPHHRTYTLMLAAAACMFMFSIGISTYIGVMTMQNQTVASPIIVMNSLAETSTELQYGAKVTFSDPDFFADITEALALSNNSFVAIDLVAMELSYVDMGVEMLRVPVQSKSPAGSLHETPSGLYKIERKMAERTFAKNAPVYPWHITFAGNSFIHGEPIAGEAALFEKQGIGLKNTDAQALFESITPETLVVVRAAAADSDDFVYEPVVPDITAPYYLMADLKNSRILAGSDLDTEVPIASLTKLMSALVALETYEAEQVIDFAGREFSTTTIPRLASSTQMNVYDLVRLMLVESSNEAAEVLADEIGRSSFIGLMNDRAHDLNLTHTQFADPSGLSASNTSSLGDLLTLTRYLNDNRSFILDVTAGSELFSVESSTLAELNNFNDVTEDDSFVAGKVGETRAAGQTSISLHEIEVKGEKRIIAVIVLNSEDLPGDIRLLTEYLKNHFQL